LLPLTRDSHQNANIMNHKNILLGTITILIALSAAYIGSAITPIYIYAKNTSSSPFVLQSVPGTCNDIGVTPCKVIVSTLTSPTGVETTTARSSSGVILFSTQLPINDSAITFYDVQ